MNSTSGKSINDIEVSQWISAPEGFRPPTGKVVAIHAFQMLCPGCVLHGVPQAQKLQALFSEEHVAVLGLHTVFEHHEAMQETSLRAFLHEFRVSFPVGIDVPSGNGPIPKTMSRFQLRGTPSWLIFDRSGALKMNVFGAMEDMALGSAITKLALQDMPPGTDVLRSNR